MTLSIPELCLVVLIGPSGCGKSTFAAKQFARTEVLSSDFFRGLVSDDENNQEATRDAFAALHFIAAQRLARGRLTVVDATNVQPEARKMLVELAREYHVFAVAIVLNLPESVCQARNATRPDRDFGPHVIRNQSNQLRRSLRGLEREGFRYVHVLSTPEEVDAAEFQRTPLWTNRKGDHGPFDLIGDVHGCLDELLELLARLGYGVTFREGAEGPEYTVRPPQGRRLVFLGDLVDRGPRVADVLRLVISAVESGAALCIPGNHDVKLLRWLNGKQVQLTHGLAESIAQLETESLEFRRGVARFLDGLVSHYVLDDGKLVVAHAGLPQALQGRSSGKVRDFALYGEKTGETDEFGLPIRYNWAADYRGNAMVVYGHTPVPRPEWLNRTLCIDTGCVFGGALTALQYPENELVSVRARRTYYEPVRPFLQAEEAAPALTQQQALDDVLDLEDVSGRRYISNRLHGTVTIREENATAALEVMSRFAANPKWLIYLPPTMSPTETSTLLELLEHPAEAFAYYRGQGIPQLICEEKHMGSRAVVIVCRDEETVRRRFGVVDDGIGICYTRTGRRFFDDRELETEFLHLLRTAVDRSGLWDDLATNWLCLDCELMPWSQKAQALITQQYAPVAAAGRASLALASQALSQAAARGLDVSALAERTEGRARMVADYTSAYRRYCWNVSSVHDLKLAPFHLLASEGHVHVDRAHTWHLQTLQRLTENDGGMTMATPHRLVDVTDEASQGAAIEWWTELTARGGEGMVVKPLKFVAQGRRGIVQPALKCRGREYLRIIYGPEYTDEENLRRLRSRSVSAKRSLAIREFALGVEALERFVRKEPLRRVHECVFGVLALESEPVDPRL